MTKEEFLSTFLDPEERSLIEKFFTEIPVPLEQIDKIFFGRYSGKKYISFIDKEGKEITSHE